MKVAVKISSELAGPHAVLSRDIANRLPNVSKAVMICKLKFDTALTHYLTWIGETNSNSNEVVIPRGQLNQFQVVASPSKTNLESAILEILDTWQCNR